MKKRILALTLLSVLSLASCAGNNVPSQSDPSLPPESPSINPPPTISPDKFSYLLGTYYAKGETLTLTDKRLRIEGKTSYTLLPASVEKRTLSYSSGGTYETLVADYPAKWNNKHYQAYINFEDGLLHIEDISDSSKTIPLGTYRPDIKSYAGVYSAFGDSSAYNRYRGFDGHFDVERGVYPENHRRGTTTSTEQYWYIKSYYTLVGNTPYLAIQEFDSDDYGYGKNLLCKDDNNIYILDGIASADKENYSFRTDVGGFNGLKLFDGSDSFITALDYEAKTLSFDGETRAYKTALTENGFQLSATIEGKTCYLSVGEYHLLVQSGEETEYYPLDNITSLYGEYSEGSQSFKIEATYDGDYNDTGRPEVYFNNTLVTDYSFVVENKRKSIEFTNKGTDYILSPDNPNSSIRVKRGMNILYPINEALYASYYRDSFVYKDLSSSFEILVQKDFSLNHKGKTSQGALTYSHGDKYPSLSWTEDSVSYTLVLTQADIGYFTLSDGKKDYILYSESVLSKLYGTYSSNRQDQFVFSPTGLRKDGKTSLYSFAPFYQENSGTYTFAVKDEEGTVYHNNLHGTFYTTKEEDHEAVIDKSYIALSLFDSLYGTYSGYGTYGRENIKFDTDGKLYLDTVNDDKTGLILDVNYTYRVRTNRSDAIILYFDYKGTKAPIYFYQDYVQIGSLQYFRSGLVDYWGTYYDEDNTLYLQDNKLYLNGKELNILDKEFKEDRTILTTEKYTFTFYKDSSTVTMDSPSSSLKLGKKFDYKDLEKFYGTYQANNSEIVFKQNSVFGRDFLIDGYAANYYRTKYNGKFALASSSFSGTYYLRLDEESLEITAEFVAASLPPLPPPPPLL